MNYKIIDDKRYVRICLDNFSEDLTPVNDTFRVIILVDKRFVNSVDMTFLNRLDKIQINFRDLLDDGQKKIIKIIMQNIRLKDEIKKRQPNINYDLSNLLINCSGLLGEKCIPIKKCILKDTFFLNQGYIKIKKLIRIHIF